MKLALGTAQFGFNYNLVGSSQTSSNEVSAILDYCREIGIKTIDTAIGYGNSEKKLGSIGVKDFNIISKLPKIDNKNNVSDFIRSEVERSLTNLKIERLHGLLLHNPIDIIGNSKFVIIETIEQLKREKLITNSGYSIYDPEEIIKLNNIYKSDIFQLPYNIFDRRFEKVIDQKNTSLKNTEIHIRSIFLKGLLLQPSLQEINHYFSKWTPSFLKWKGWLYDNNIDPLQACLNLIKKNNQIDSIIVGVDSLIQLRSIYDAYINDSYIYPDNCFINDINLLDPRKWNFK